MDPHSRRQYPKLSLHAVGYQNAMDVDLRVHVLRRISNSWSYHMIGSDTEDKETNAINTKIRECVINRLLYNGWGAARSSCQVSVVRNNDEPSPTTVPD